MNDARGSLMKRMIYVSLAFLLLAAPISSTSFSETSQHATTESSSSQKPIGAKTGEKGGIYVVGRAFKSAGHSMGEGFKAAGRGIKKGGVATGHAFQKAGHSIKNFFTGEKDAPKSNNK
jgi:hypothetical protein